jgi:iron-sulfur cluster repair protein YtfE (RIC family)
MEKDYYTLFAAHHRRLIGSIDELGKRAGEDVLSTPELLTYLWEHLVPHAQGEEVSLYKCVEALPGGNGIVQPMIGEHQVIVGRIRELGQLFEAQKDSELQNVLHSVLALIHEHFQKEEEVLIPLLRQHLTAAEFGAQIEEAHKREHERKPSDIKRFMDVDHRRVDRILTTFSALKRGDLAKASALFTRGREDLLRHIFWEEEMLFPAFEEKTNLRDSGPTVVMRQEHSQIRAGLEKIKDLLDDGKLADLDTAEQELAKILAVHNKKEELILYPMINKNLSSSERKELLMRMG